MKLKFNRTERMAGIFVLFAIAGTLGAATTVMIKKGVFSPKVNFYTMLKSSNNIRPGTPVQLSGIRVGGVDSIELESSGQVRVNFTMYRKFNSLIKEDSRVHLIRPSVIGEKLFEIIPGKSGEALTANSRIESEEQDDVMDVLSGNRLSTLLDHVDSVTIELVELMRQISHKKNVQALLDNMRATATDLRKSFLEKGPGLSNDITQIVKNLNQLSHEMASLSANLPEGSKKAVELLSESVTLIKAMQRNFFLRGAVSDIKEEEAAKKKESDNRQPASAAQPAPAK